MAHRSIARALGACMAVAALAAARPAFGPPWISIESPPNPYEASSRGAVLVVHTFHHGTPVGSGVSGTAEGIVQGARRSVRLAFDTTSRVGIYALRKQWAGEGTWMLVINTGGPTNGATALVDLDANGAVAHVQVPTRRQDGWTIPRAVSAEEITAALERRAKLVAARSD